MIQDNGYTFNKPFFKCSNKQKNLIKDLMIKRQGQLFDEKKFIEKIKKLTIFQAHMVIKSLMGG